MTQQQQTATSVSYFIAVPGDDQASGIFGIGTTHEGAVQDAYKQSNSREPTVDRDGDGTWFVSTDTGLYETFRDETEARDFGSQKGFIARECTERLYRHIEAHGCDANHFRWTQTVGGLDDLDVDQDLVDAAVAEVKAGFEGTSAAADTTPETALQDAHDYVDAYVVDDEAVDEDLRDAIDEDKELRTAIDVAVKKLLLDELAEREAA